MAEQRHLDLVDRLRGQYHIPVNDGAGPLNGSMTFSREFQTPPIQKEAAAEIERLRTVFSSAIGRVLNAMIDLETGKTKNAVSRTLAGIVKDAEMALTPPQRPEPGHE